MSEAFVPDCYGIRSNGRPMPAKFIGLDAGGCVELAAPNGRTYTFRPDRVLAVDAAEEQIRREKAEAVACAYQFTTVKDRPSYKIVNCVNPERPDRSNYVIMIAKIGNLRRSCTCPANQKDPAVPCKHLRAYQILEDGEKPRPVTEAVPPAIPERKSERRDAHIYTSEDW